MFSRKQWIYAIPLVVVLSASAALACRFTVRDIGFVELRGPEYSLVATLGTAGSTSADNLASAARSPLDSWLSELGRKLADSNVHLSIQHSSSPTGDDELSNGDAERIVSLKLIRRDGGSLELSDTLPSALTLESQNTAEEKATVDSWLGENLFSETLDALGQSAINSFVQIVVIEGDDSQSNQAARQVADQAVEAIRKIEPMLPRPIAFPVRVRHIEFAQRSAEPILLWAVQDAAVDNHDAARHSASVKADAEATAPPILMVLYGRGRLAGPAMSGNAIELRETLAQLALVGESCECETDRAWMDERVIPFRWSSELRKQASTSLGFDPDSPLVQAEMTRIVSQGFNSARTARERGDGRDDIERLLLGYAEALLTPYPTDQTTSNTTLPTTSALSPVRAQIVAGDGWDFDDTAPTSDATALLGADASSGSNSLQQSDSPQTVHSGSIAESSALNNPPDAAREPDEKGYITHTTTSTSGFSFSLFMPVGVTLGVLFLLVFVSALLLMGRKQ